MLRKLVEAFQDRVDLPIEIDEIREQIIALGVQDKIIFSAEDLDTGILRGALYQWTEHQALYGDPVWTTLIVYPENEPLEIQRVICAKELVHVCDSQIVKAHSPDMVEELARKVVGPFETRLSTSSDLMASLDKLAQYLSLNLLFPRAARTLARERMESESISKEEVADWAVLPVDAIELSLNENWERLSELLVSLGNGDHLAY